nr:hypothetical protein [Pedobacter kyonggii]
MATYNWKYTANTVISDYITAYNFTIPDTADDVKPTDVSYVALFGNDETGNGSRMYPWRTINHAKNSSGFIILSSGVYREGVYNFPCVLVADGDVVIDHKFFEGTSYNGTIPFGIKIINMGNSGLIRRNEKCLYDGGGSQYSQLYDGCLGTTYKDFATMDFYGGGALNTLLCGFNTFVNIQNMEISSLEANSQGNFWHSIFDNCTFNYQSGKEPQIDYSLFHNCRMQIQDSGYIDINTIEDLKSLIQTYYPNNAYFKNCVVADPKFNNRAIGDFSLAFDSPAKNASYFGTCIGAESIGYAILARTDNSLSGFDEDTNQNLTITDDSIVLSDESLDASIETKVIPNLSQRELSKAPLFGFNADRNGQYIDSFADLDTVSIPATDVLKPYTPYLVAEAAITYNGNAILPGSRFTTRSEVVFTTENGGTCIEILEAPQRHTVLARFSNGGAQKNIGDNLTVGFWYYVTGLITHSGENYSDQAFKATANSSFTGTGSVIEAMTDEDYQHYEPGIKFTSNNAGDERLGDIVRGNGDPNYERGAGKEFPINARFIQIKYIIRVNNLKP